MRNGGLQRRIMSEIIWVCLGAVAVSVPVIWGTVGFHHLKTLAIMDAVVMAYLAIWSNKHREDLRETTEGKSMTSLGPANLITMSRMMMIPTAAIALAYLGPGATFPQRLAALLSVMLVSVTDCLDGYIARRSGQVTRFGMFLDPTADFFLLLTLSTALTMRGLAPTWLLALIILKVLLLMIGGTFILNRRIIDRTALSPLRLGKLSTLAVASSMIAATAGWTFGVLESRLTIGFLIMYSAAGLLLVLAIGEKFVWFLKIVRRGEVKQIERF